MTSLVIILIYLSFVVDFLIWPIPSEAATVSLLRKKESWSKISSVAIAGAHAGLLILWLLPLLISLMNTWSGHHQPVTTIHWIGLGLALVGRFVTLKAGQILRTNGTDSVITDSLFRYSRHPIVVGLHLTLAGIVLVTDMPWLWIPYGLSLIYFDYKVRIEETALQQKFGRTYADYFGRTPRYLLI